LELAVQNVEPADDCPSNLRKKLKRFLNRKSSFLVKVFLQGPPIHKASFTCAIDIAAANVVPAQMGPKVVERACSKCRRIVMITNGQIQNQHHVFTIFKWLPLSTNFTPNDGYLNFFK
jgi:hypothetical protein